MVFEGGEGSYTQSKRARVTHLRNIAYGTEGLPCTVILSTTSVRSNLEQICSLEIALFNIS